MISKYLPGINNSKAGIVAPAIAIAVQNGSLQLIGPRKPDTIVATPVGPIAVDCYWLADHQISWLLTDRHHGRHSSASRSRMIIYVCKKTATNDNRCTSRYSCQKPEHAKCSKVWGQSTSHSKEDIAPEGPNHQRTPSILL